MKESISTFCWDRLGLPLGSKYVTFKKIAGALFEKSAHSCIFYDLENYIAINT
jgi:hypothetical protein